MAKMKYVHIIINNSYTAPYIELVNSNFERSEHNFYVVRGWSEEKVKIPGEDNVYPISNAKNILNGFRLLKDVNRSRKIFIHGLFSPYLLLILISQPWLFKKANWAVWGADLYKYLTPKTSWGARMEEWLRRICIRRFAELTCIKGDYELARKWYDAKGTYRFAMYSTPLRTREISKIVSGLNKAPRDVISIQIGNSATPDNNHFEILDLLKKYSGDNIRIYALLSYGDSEYGNEVIAYGKNIFKEKFVGVTQYMAFPDFVQFMNGMDIIIFNHRRQQGLGNLLLASFLKKKIFMSRENTLWELLNSDYDMRVNDTAIITQLDFENFKALNDTELEWNKSRVELVADERYVIGLWSNLFDK